MQHTFVDVQQGTDEWMNLRLGRITASTFKDLMSAKSTAGYQKVVNNCIFEQLTGKAPENFKSDWMERGNEVEPLAMEWYLEQVPHENVTEGGFYQIGPYFGDSPDGHIGEDGILEIKCPSPHVFIQYLLKDTVPSAYKWQLQGHLYASKREYCDFVAFHPDFGGKIITIKPDPELQKELHDRIIETENLIEVCIEKLKGSVEA